jgi:two-component sensor histidine kinase
VAAYILFLLTLKVAFPPLPVILIELLFLLCIFLSRKKLQILSGGLFVLSANLAIIYFSFVLGFNMGSRLYFFSAPFVVFLMFDLRQRTEIILSLGAYLACFIFLFWSSHLNVFAEPQLPKNIAELIYLINFLVSLSLCITLILVFVSNSGRYIQLLEEMNASLEEKKAELQREVSEKQTHEAELYKTRREKDTLLAEVHHRVKNNLAVISGLIELQNMYVKDEKTAAILRESRNRIKSIAVVEEKYFENKSLGKVEIRSFVDEALYFARLSNFQSKIKVETHIDNIELNLNKALSFSLLMNELLTNAFKHAFKQREEGMITISLTKAGHELFFKLRDNGCGFDIAHASRENTLGMNLIDAFSKQLHGKTSFTSKPGEGTEFSMNFTL